MARAHLASVHGVVAELVVTQRPVLVAQQAVAAHHLGIEINLDLGIPGYRLQRTGEVFDEDPLRLVQGIDIIVTAIAVVGKLLHEHIVVVAHAKADGGQTDALIDVAANGAQNALRPRVADIGDTVGKQDDAGDAIRPQVLRCELVAKLQPLLCVGAAVRIEAVDRSQDRGFVRTAGGLQKHTSLVAVNNDADFIGRSQLVHQQRESLLDQPQPVFHVHRAGYVDDEDQGCILAVLIRDDLALQPGAHQVVFLTAEG